MVSVTLVQHSVARSAGPVPAPLSVVCAHGGSDIHTVTATFMNRDAINFQHVKHTSDTIYPR